mmetsp:Transcript_19987/g.63580  ORF Transcript_19987/g.63580 Transcript_19987/m.63580 type:complete len:219 (-) Transcript_19987:5-661(-)
MVDGLQAVQEGLLHPSVHHEASKQFIDQHARAAAQDVRDHALGALAKTGHVEERACHPRGRLHPFFRRLCALGNLRKQFREGNVGAGRSHERQGELRGVEVERRAGAHRLRRHMDGIHVPQDILEHCIDSRVEAPRAIRGLVVREDGNHVGRSVDGQQTAPLLLNCGHHGPLHELRGRLATGFTQIFRCRIPERKHLEVDELGLRSGQQGHQQHRAHE